MNINYEKLGSRIRTARMHKNLTQEELAEKVDVSNNYISNIELNRSKPSLATLIKICNVLEITPDYVLADSVHSSNEYIKDEIAKMLRKCSPASIRLIEKVIAAILDEQDTEK